MPSFVTGASGFIGSHLTKTLTDAGEDVIALVRDIVPSKWLNEALAWATKVRGDLRNFNLLKRVITQYEVDYVFHLGALSSVKTAYKDPINVYNTNVIGTVNVLEACRQVGVERVLVLITDKVFGERMNAIETDPLQASEPYATSKCCAQLITESYKKTYGLNTIIARSCNVYGLDYSNRIIPNTIRACLRGESPVIFEGEEQTLRQYIHVTDVVEALIHLMNKTYPEARPSYNICTDDVLNQKEVVLKILKFFPNLKPKYVKREAPPEISRQSMVLTDFGWNPRLNFEEGIRQTISAFRVYGW